VTNSVKLSTKQRKHVEGNLEEKPETSTHVN